MTFIISPNRKSGWVASNHSREEIADRLKGTDLLITDLDGTITPSPAIRFASSKLKNPEYLGNPLFRKWCIVSAARVAYGKLTGEKRKAEVTCWERFQKEFLEGNPEELLQIEQTYTDEFARKTTFSGVPEFYDQINPIFRIMLTRNIAPLSMAYVRTLGLSPWLKEKRKISALENMMAHLKKGLNVVCVDDSEELDGMLKFLRHLKGGFLKEVTGIYVSKSPRRLHPGADINIGRDYTGLVSLLD